MRISLPKPKPCAECGSDPIYHQRQYILLFVDTLVMPFLSSLEDWFTAPLRKGTTVGTRKKTSFWVYMLDAFVSLRLGSYLDAYDEKTLLLDQVLWDEARTRQIPMKEFRLLNTPLATFVATTKQGVRVSFMSFPVPRGVQAAAWWIDTKSIMKRKFENLGIPVAKGGAAMTLRGAKKIYTTLIPPVIVKPYEGSGSRHTTIHISSPEALAKAFAVSQQITAMSIIEEELVGDVYRPTVVGGKLVATIRRDKPSVTGDGIHTVRELVAEENKHPKRQGPYYQHIRLDHAEEKELARQGYTFESILPAGTQVELNQKINWSVGGTTTDVTEEVHPDNVALFEKIAEVLHAPLVGIDFIIKDISKSWKSQERCGVIECNSRPFFDNHHLPFNGKPRNVAGAIWDYAGF